MQGHFKKIHVTVYILLPCKYILCTVSFTSIFDRTISIYLHCFMRMRCQYRGQTGSHINCTNDKWYIYVRVMVYALFPVCGVFFVKLTSIYKWRACYNQISQHISASDQEKFAFKYLLYLSVICKNSCFDVDSYKLCSLPVFGSHEENLSWSPRIFYIHHWFAYRHRPQNIDIWNTCNLIINFKLNGFNCQALKRTEL